MKAFTIAIIVFTILCGVAGAVPSESVGSASTVEREDGSSIHYYLEGTPQGSGSETLLIAFQGSDCNSVKHDEFLRTFSKDLWPSADLLLVEKRGITSNLHYDSNPERPDCPASYIDKDSPEQRVRDAHAVVSRVLERETYKNILAVGGSEGATVAAMFAAKSGFPDAVVMVNGGGRWFLDDVLHNIKATTPEHQLSSELEGFKGFADHILNSDPFDIEISGHGYAWWRSVLTIDQKSVLSQIEVPTLVVQGGRDVAVSPEAVTEMIEELRNEGKNNIELVVYPGMDHKLFGRDERPMAEEVSADIASWLKAVTGAAR